MLFLMSENTVFEEWRQISRFFFLIQVIFIGELLL